MDFFTYEKLHSEFGAYCVGEHGRAGCMVEKEAQQFCWRTQNIDLSGIHEIFIEDIGIYIYIYISKISNKLSTLR